MTALWRAGGQAGALPAGCARPSPLAAWLCGCRGRQVALDMAEGLDQLHTRHGILHSDLKPA